MKTVLQQNKDLDLRRFGKDLYTKAKESGGWGMKDNGNLGKQIAEAFVDNIFKRKNISVPSNFVYPDFAANSQYHPGTNETEVTVIDSIPALIESIDSNNGFNTCLYKQKPFETSPYTITGNESKVYIMSDELYPTIEAGFGEYKVNVEEIQINGETFYSITPYMEPVPGPGGQL